MKILFILIASFLLTSCVTSGTIITKCIECKSSTNAYYIDFKKRVKVSSEDSFNRVKGLRGVEIAQDKYMIYIVVSRAVNQKRVIKKCIKVSKHGK